MYVVKSQTKKTDAVDHSNFEVIVNLYPKCLQSLGWNWLSLGKLRKNLVLGSQVCHTAMEEINEDFVLASVQDSIDYYIIRTFNKGNNCHIGPLLFSPLSK